MKLPAHLGVRVGLSKDKSLADMARECSKGLRSMSIGRGDVPKYVEIVREGTQSYYIMLSTSDRLTPDYNTILTVQGGNKSRVEELIEECVGRMPIPMKEAPEYLKQRFARIAMIMAERGLF